MKIIYSSWFAIKALLVIATTCAAVVESSNNKERKVLNVSKDYELLEVVPHDTSSFTQGLTFHNGHIYEGTGLEHQSHIFQHDPSNSMTTLRKIPLVPAHYFGEGIASYSILVQDDENDPTTKRKEHRLIQLTWKNKKGFIYSLDTTDDDNGDGNDDNATTEESKHLKLIREFDYDTVTGEGWGITFLPHTSEFYISDGSHYLSIWDVETLQVKRVFPVKFLRQRDVGGEMVDEWLEVKMLNELEFVDFETGGDGSDHVATTATNSSNDGDDTCANNNDGDDTATTTCSSNNNNNKDSPHKSSMRILANVWYQDLIVSIHPETGEVERVYDFSDLYPRKERVKDGADVLNGISLTGASTAENGEDGVELWVTGKLWPNMYRVRIQQYAD